MFGLSSSTLSAKDRKAVADFVKSWIAGGSREEVNIDGYASMDGPQELNWRLSCDRAEAVKAELIAQGVPAGNITTFAHCETDEFSRTSLEQNRRAIVSTIAAPPTITTCGPPPSCPVGGTAPLLRDPHIPRVLFVGARAVLTVRPHVRRSQMCISAFLTRAGVATMSAPTQTSLSAEAIRDVVTMTTATTGVQRLENETSAMQAEHAIAVAIWRAYEPTE